MLNYCIFCYKTCDKDRGSLGQGGDTGRRSEILKKFLTNLGKLLNRDKDYDLNEIRSKNGGFEDLSSSSFPQGSGLNACEDCLKTVKSFCDLYNDFERIKLLLNWKLEAITNTMTTSTPRLPRMGDLGIFQESNEKLISFREDLINKMSSTRFNSYPKIILERTQIARICTEALLPTTENLSKGNPNAKDNPGADKNSIGKEWELEDDVGSEAHGMEVDEDFVLSDPDLSSDEENSNTSEAMDTEGPVNPQKKLVNSEVKPEILFVKLEKKDGPEKCNLCTKSYSTNFGLRNHKRKVHPDQNEAETPLQTSYRFKCPNCEDIFEKIHLLQFHWRDSHLKDEPASDKPSDKLSVEVITISLDSKGHICENLKKNFARIEVPQLKPEAEVKICSTCQRIFYSQEEFEAHEKLHGSFACAVCPTEKSFLPELSIHEARAHSKTIKNSPNVWKCLRCEMKFADATSYLRHHLEIHFSLLFSEHSCVICKAFLLKYEQRKDIHKLFRHIENCHNLNRPSKSGEVFKCEEVNCAAYFTTLRGLTSHRKIVHLLDQDKLKDLKLERNLSVCEECGKSFPSSGRLKTHLISHTSRDSWEFCCEICSRKCQTKSKLEIHLKTHTGEQPFVCEVCGAKYTAKHKLKAHFEKKHGKL